jgi:hypothetical protein
MKPAFVAAAIKSSLGQNKKKLNPTRGELKAGRPISETRRDAVSHEQYDYE